MGTETITIRGIRQGLLAKLGAVEWGDALDELAARVAATPEFYRDGRLALDVGDRELGRAELERARSLLESHRVELWAVLSRNDVTRLVAHDMGMVVDLELPQPQRAQRRGAEQQLTQPYADALVVRRTLRSGQSLRHSSDVIIIGDVNHGAEVIAGGDIIVWGKARGILHAGAVGDEQAIICALDLSATQVRIAAHIARAPEGRMGRPVPEMASIRDGQIVAVPWSGSKLGRTG